MRSCISFFLPLGLGKEKRNSRDFQFAPSSKVIVWTQILAISFISIDKLCRELAYKKTSMAELYLEKALQNP